MTLRRIRVTDFRCLGSAELVCDPRFTLISGSNASGKTSLLEAIYVLARGRSFRTRHLDHLIRSNSARFIVSGEVEVAARSLVLGVEGSGDGVRARIGGERVASLAELAVSLPAQVIDPEVHRLIEEGPSRRRRYLDWGVFHVEHSFLSRWQSYQVVLRQRNAALRRRSARPVVSAWDGELLRLGNLIDASRAQYVQSLYGVAAPLVQRLLGSELSLSYRSGWQRECDFADALKESWRRDYEAGTTQVGPQRAELAIRLNGDAVKDRISRGQQKLLAAALLLAQISLFPRDAEIRPTLLLDDPAAELDRVRLIALLAEVSQQDVQLVVTSLHPDFNSLGVPGRRYTVSGGVLSEA